MRVISIQKWPSRSSLCWSVHGTVRLMNAYILATRSSLTGAKRDQRAGWRALELHDLPQGPMQGWNRLAGIGARGRDG